MNPTQRKLLAAQGYSDLGMFDDAVAELDSPPSDARDIPDVIEARVHVLMRARRWAEALDASNGLCLIDPAAGSGFVHAAFCLHELGRTQDAKDRLLSGPKVLRNHAIFHYNLACYDAILGHPSEAIRSLRHSIQLDEKFREFARIDPDLASIRDKMQG
jgi:tetratricopeptide (TPR) repeat protein